MELNGYAQVCWVVQNIAGFEFRTHEAQGLKQEMRAWYYGDRDPARAEALAQRFRSLCSFNMILGVLGESLWAVAGQAPVGKGPELDEALGGVPHGSVTALSLKSCCPGDEWRSSDAFQRLLQTQRAQAKAVLEPAVKGLEKACQRERAWYRENGMSGPAALGALIGIAALLAGLAFLFFALFMTLDHDFEWMVWELGGRNDLPDELTMILLALVLICTIYLLTQARGLFLTVWAGLVWVFSQKRIFTRRERLVYQVRSGLARGCDGYCRQLYDAARVLASQPPGAPMNADPSRALLGASGLPVLFQGVILTRLPECASLQSFCELLGRRRLKHRSLAVMLSFALLLALLFLTVTI